MWVENNYIYTKRTLHAIAQGYATIYEGLGFSYHTEITNPLLLVEYKVDFDNALNSIGKGIWHGIVSHNLSDYRNFSRKQQSIIADILAVKDNKLYQMGFYDIHKLRSLAYYFMTQHLNGGKNVPKDNPRTEKESIGSN